MSPQQGPLSQRQSTPETGIKRLVLSLRGDFSESPDIMLCTSNPVTCMRDQTPAVEKYLHSRTSEAVIYRAWSKKYSVFRVVGYSAPRSYMRDVAKSVL